MAEDEIRQALQEKKAILGTEETLDELKKGQLEKVFISSNTPEPTKKDISHYAEMTDTEIEHLEATNEELGTICKKPYVVSVLGIKAR